MIFVFKESEKDWRVSKVNNTTNVLTYGAEDFKGEPTNIHRDVLGILGSNEIINGYIAKSVNNANKSEIVKISDRMPRLYFSDKKMQPFISRGDVKDNKAMLIANLAFNGNRFIDAECKDVYMLNNQMKAGYLNFIALFNKEVSLKIRLMNRDKTEVIENYFTFKDGEITRTVITKKVSECTLPEKRYFLERFIPRKPTSMILAYDKKVSEVKEKLERPENHRIRAYNSYTLDKVISGCESDNYDAVTLYMGFESNNEILKKKALRNVFKLTKKFSVVSLMYTDKVIELFKR